MPGEDGEETLAWETLGTEIDYTCPGFDVRRDDVRLPDSTETEYHYVDEPPAVVILPFVDSGPADGSAAEPGNPGERLLLIEEWRQAVNRVNRGLPAGTIEGDEPPVQAARRELREETGYAAGEVEHLCTVEPTNGMANSVHHHFVAFDCAPARDQDLDFNESIRPITVPYREFRTAVLADEVPDGRATLAVSRYELTRLARDDNPG